jgi:hypothetical protein
LVAVAQAELAMVQLEVAVALVPEAVMLQNKPELLA